MKKLVTVALSAALVTFAGAALAAGTADKGKAIFTQKGCWQCHGYEGQGGSAGLRIANTQLNEEQLIAFVHTTNGPMPPFSEKLVSNAELSDVYAYLQSRPKPADPDTIPLLK